jgi:hypothetical protein
MNVKVAFEVAGLDERWQCLPLRSLDITRIFK